MAPAPPPSLSLVQKAFFDAWNSFGGWPWCVSVCVCVGCALRFDWMVPSISFDTIILFFEHQHQHLSIMAPLQTILSILVLPVIATSFTPTHFLQRRNCHFSPLYQSGPDKGGGSAIATPATKQVTTTVTKQKSEQKQKQKAKPSDPDLRNEEDFEDAPMFRLFLIGDESYEQEHVVTRVFEVVEDCSEDEAARLFKSAYQTGEAFLGKYPKEIAETYAEQLTRSDPIIYADVRSDDDKTKKN